MKKKIEKDFFGLHLAVTDLGLALSIGTATNLLYESKAVDTKYEFDISRISKAANDLSTFAERIRNDLRDETNKFDDYTYELFLKDVKSNMDIIGRAYKTAKSMKDRNEIINDADLIMNELRNAFMVLNDLKKFMENLL